MAQEPLEKMLLASAGLEGAERAPAPPASSAMPAKPSSTRRLLRVGGFVLPGGVVLLLFGVLGAFYSWKVDSKEISGKRVDLPFAFGSRGRLCGLVDRGFHLTQPLQGFMKGLLKGLIDTLLVYCLVERQAWNEDPTVLGALWAWLLAGRHFVTQLRDIMLPSQTYSVHYTVSIDGKIQEGSMEVDTANNLQIFKTGSGREEATEVHDFQLSIAGTHFAGGEKCFIKAQAKIHIPEVSAMAKESLSFDLQLEEGDGMSFDSQLDHEGICCIEGTRSYTHCRRICEPLSWAFLRGLIISRGVTLLGGLSCLAVGGSLESWALCERE